MIYYVVDLPDGPRLELYLNRDEGVETARSKFQNIFFVYLFVALHFFFELFSIAFLGSAALFT